MNIYSFHPITKEYISESIADESPLEIGKYLIPAFATTEQPPKAGKNEVVIYADGWQIVPDFRGADAWSPVTREKVKITKVGKTLADLGLVDFEPPLTAEEIKQQHNTSILSQITSLESLLIRPMRELLSTEITDKTFAQAKVDDIERQIQALRAQLIK